MLRRIRSMIILAATLVVLGLLTAAHSPEQRPELFAPGIISTQTDESSGSFSPDGKVFYFVERANYTTTPPMSIICVSRVKNGNWTEPEVVSFSGIYLDSSPRVAPDGKRLFFASRRPAPPATRPGRWKIFVVDITANGWGQPHALPSPVASDGNDTNPTTAADGMLYFASDRDGQPGYFHLYRARLTNGKYEQPEKLGPEINSGDAELNPYISPDQKLLIFASYRKDNLAAGGNHYDRADLYVSVNCDGHWTPARHLEHGVNSTASEGNPAMSPDGKWFYFTTERSPFEIPMKQKVTTASWKDRQRTIENGVGNIYRISAEALELDR